MTVLNPQDLFIVGPTAAGKSNFALKVCEQLNYSIVNCDSLQFYSDLKIGTASPSNEDFLKSPHYLFGIAKSGEVFTAGEFIRHFEALRKNVKSKSNGFLIVGGSGFYIQALETGMLEIETLTDEMKHKVSFLNTWSLDEKIKTLKEVDPESLNYIHIHDEYRIHRALEVYFSQGKKMSDVKRNPSLSSHPKVGLYLHREELLSRVKLRVDHMLQSGLIDEVQSLIDQGLSEWKPLQSVGYKEVLLFLNQKISFEEMKSLIQKNTMNLAKRQMTWFRSDPSVVWFHSETEHTKAMDWVLQRKVPRQSEP